ncbi:MAG: VWA domain-containing protein, partial [Myxococcales bacterium]|nr:VWA domain-containing protein [Myxococcales bacterium]
MKRQTGRVGRVGLVGLVGLVLLLGGCAPKSEQLRSLLKAGDFEEVIEEGNAWLDETPPRKDPAERQRVAVVIAEAELARTSVLDRVEEYQRYRARYDGAHGLAGVLALALARESEAAWRDEATHRDDEAAYRQFRVTYPDSPHLPEARRREVARGFRAAAATMGDQQAFRDRFAGWRELAEYEGRSRTIEVEAAFALVHQHGTVPGWRGFRAAYAEWPEAAAHVREALTLEAGVALAEAESSLEALEAFQVAYPDPPWPARAEGAIARLVLHPVLAPIRHGEAPLDSTLAAFFAEHAGRPGLAEVADPLRADIIRTAIESGRSGPLRLCRVLFPDDPAVRPLLAIEQALAWEEVSAADDADRWRAFVLIYPDHPRADEAEAHAFRLQHLRDAELGWPRADVAWSRTLPSGEIELAVDVVDCEGSRVSGLTREAFEVHAAGFPQEITDFKGLEEERPLDVVFAIDLSGSMAAEHEAVRQAVMFFAEIFQFRGRQARLGLVTFAEQVARRDAPTGRVATFQGWMRTLPAVGGGGMGEDSTLALVASADLLKRAPGERVAILLTDEDLQANRGGQKALGVSSGAACGRLQRAGECITRCKNVACFARCYGLIGPAQRKAMNRCTRRLNAALCASAVDWDALALGLAACVEPVADDSDTAERLAARLASARVRPFFLVPAVDQTAGRAILGHHGVARMAQGRVLEVPQDGEDPAPYVRALVDIADQLSKQYVLRFRPADAAARAA